jgi:phage tail tape measure protein, TP901 family, core region
MGSFIFRGEGIVISNSLVVRVGANIKDFEKELGKMTTETNKVGNTLVGIGNNLTKSVTKPLLGVAGASVYVGSKFQANMSNVEAATGASAKEMEMLETAARDMGNQSVYSASEVADAMYKMGLAGWDTQQTLAGLEPVLNLATAAKMSLEDTTAIVTKGLTAFGLEAEDAGRFTDVLATANKNANTDVRELGEAFKYVGPVAGALGYTIEDTALALGLMADAGIVGSQAGTTLKRAIEDLTNPSEEAADLMADLGISMFDSAGEAKPLNDIIKDLRGSLGDMEQEQQMAAASTLFSSSALSGMLGIINASDEDFHGLIDNLENAEGNAKKFADIMTDNLQSELKILKNNLQDVGITIFEIMVPALNKGVEFLKKMLERFQQLSPEAQENIVKYGALAAALGPVITLGGKAVIMFGQMKAALLLKKGAVAAAGSAIGVGKVGLAGKIAGLTGGTKVAAGALGMTKLGLGGTLAALPMFINPVTVGIGALAGTGYVVHKAMTQEAIPAMDLFVGSVEYAADGTVIAKETISEETQEIVGAFMDMSLEVGTEVNTMWATQTEVTEENSKEIISKVNGMHEHLLEGYQTEKEEALRIQQEKFSGMKSMSEEELEKLAQDTKDHFDFREKTTQQAMDEIHQILETAKNEQRALTNEENEKIQALNEVHQKEAINLAAEDAREQELILRNLANSKERINAEMLSDAVTKINEQYNETVSKAEAQRDETVRAALEQRDETIAEIEHQRDVLGVLSEEQAAKMIDEAKRTTETTVREAEDLANGTIQAADRTRTKGLNRLESAHEELRGTVDLETGEILSHWGKLKNWWSNWWPETKIARIFTRSDDGPQHPRHANGTPNFAGGLTWVNERGPELINLQRGASIIPAPLSGLMAQEYGRERAREDSHRQEIVVAGDSGPTYLVVDKKILGEVLADPVKESQNRSSIRARSLKGGGKVW